MFDAVLPAACLILAITLLVQSVANRSLRTEIKYLREQIQLLRDRERK